ncbi:MAG: hypothetical protein E6R08_09305 [Nevskiaceae bacterium]|nr:MAG: hypothetical protein E6R08_09305 [Nevskiaceae bacterium]
MKERPILFSGPMVRAILSGQKTVTRRVVKPQFQAAPVDVVDGVPSWDSPTNYAGEVQMNTQHGKPCPYGKPGDRLWVREAWAQINVAQAPGESWVVYRECDNRTDYGGPWKPSIHMRRRDSRILLEVTDVRVERLQDISDDQAEAEGIEGCIPSCPGPYDEHGNPECDCMNLTYKQSFQALWESINGRKSWDADPWVWVVEFKRIEP